MPKVTIDEFREYSKNTLIGYCNVELVDLGMIIKGCSVHQKEGKPWISFPQRSYKNIEGEAVWVDIIAFSDKEKRGELQSDMVSAFHGFMAQEYNEPGAPPDETESDIPF